NKQKGLICTWSANTAMSSDVKPTSRSSQKYPNFLVRCSEFDRAFRSILPLGCRNFTTSQFHMNAPSVNPLRSFQSQHSHTHTHTDILNTTHTHRFTKHYTHTHTDLLNTTHTLRFTRDYTPQIH